MKLMKILFVILIEGLVSLAFLHGPVIESHQNEAFSKVTNDIAVAGEGLQYNAKTLLTNGNPMISSSKAVYSPKNDDILKIKSHRRKKGKGRKRNPCLRKYKDFCIHGECRYLKEQKSPSCVCQAGYHGERCHALTLPSGNPSNAYDHTTVLAVVAVGLSSFCLIVISSLLIIRCHRRGAYNVENGEKLKFGHPM
ncbi:proheparin-binding EGF-like growth factor [Pyxicephalus adspersus]|uniref:proheparin-binding EGF-like growth factor n=1 Tax=Pyxicephalus adspersus TaxID=30357 RepID=UPI003B5BA7A6